MKRTMTAVISGVALAAFIGAGVAAASETGPGSRVADALSALVGKGTISQDQADAVTKALDDARTTERADRDAARAAQRDQMDTLLTDTLGMDPADVHEELAAGSTLRGIAGDKAKDLSAALLARLDTRLKTAVTDGRITQEQATTTLDRARTQADAWLAGDDNALGGRGLGGLLGGRGMAPGMGGPGMGGPGMGGPGMGGPGMGGPGMGGRDFGDGQGSGGMGRGWSDRGADDSGPSGSDGSTSSPTLNPSSTTAGSTWASATSWRA